MPARSSFGFDWLEGDVGELRERYERLHRVTDGGRCSWETIEHQGRGVRLLIQHPRRWLSQDRVIIYFHGGGWIVGSPLTHADISRALCEEAGMAVLSVDYRLAPEHRAPAPIEDGQAVLAHVLGTLAAEGKRMSAILCGDSAGAAITLAVERRVDQVTRQAIAGVCSLYGGFGVLNSESLRQRGSRHAGLDRACVQRMWTLANAPGESSPYAIAALASPSRVPAYLLAASEDPLLDDTLALAAAYRSCRRQHVLEVVAGETHGFLHDVGMSKAASAVVARLGRWMGSLDPSGTAGGPRGAGSRGALMAGRSRDEPGPKS